MDGDKPRDIRIGNDERGRALDALGEHFTSGRLDHTEYEERVQLAASAHTRSELEGLFGDLPEPTPFGSGVVTHSPGPSRSPATTERTPAQTTRGKKLVQTLNLFAGGGTLLLFLLLQVVFDVPNAWLVFIVFPLVAGGIRIWSDRGVEDNELVYDDSSSLDRDELRRRRDIESRRRREFGY
jgi:hypothetical protein